MNIFHENMMRRALSLARRGVGRTAPNPAVGCVIVRDGVIVGEGWHRKAGTPHAEVHALRAAGDAACGADLYVTLEPCSHFGKTPPCADAILAAGVARVYVGMVDPNPRVCGTGLERLRNNGVQIETGILEQECRRLNEPFIKQVTTGTPFVTLKSALTLDGKSATSTGDSKWVTNDKSREYVHRLRAVADVIMVGVGTVIADDPQLTTRLRRGSRDPLRVIVDSSLRIPPHARVFNLDSSASTVVATISGDQSKIDRLRQCGAELLQCREHAGRVDLRDLLSKLGERGVQSVLLEGGGELAGEAHRLGIIDKYLLFYAPKLTGGGDGPGLFSGSGVTSMADACLLKDVKVRRFGDDILVQGYPEAQCLPV